MEEPAAAGFLTMKSNPEAAASVSLSQYLTAMLVVRVINICAPAVTPRPKPSEPVMSLGAFRRRHRLHGRGHRRAQQRGFLRESRGHAKERRGRGRVGSVGGI